MAREEEEAKAIKEAGWSGRHRGGGGKRLLVEHAARLKDFLPKGVLASARTST